jgi:hypothetical protein
VPDKKVVNPNENPYHSGQDPVKVTEWPAEVQPPQPPPDKTSKTSPSDGKS